MARRGEDSGWLALWQEACAEGEDGFHRVLEQVVKGMLEEEEWLSWQQFCSSRRDARWRQTDA